MSNFKVEVRSIGALGVHPNADKLEIAHLNGLTYQFVVGKGSFSVNELVVYFPLDALIPSALAQAIGLAPKGEKAFRVKSIRLRGMWSEGVLAPLSVIGLDPKLAEEGLDLTEKLGVVKYEPIEFQENIFKGQRPDNLIALPTTVHKYDIENLQRYPSVHERLADVVVHVTEKLEGSHWWARIDKDGETVHVGQRNFEIKRGDESKNVEELHSFWQLLYKENLDDYLYWLYRHFPGYDITIRGEAIGMGVQGNYYGLKGREVYLFEIELNGAPVASQTFFDLAELYRNGLKSVKLVPLLYKFNTLNELGDTPDKIVNLAHGTSVIVSDMPGVVRLREGIVIKPASNEMYHPEIGRLFIKVRDAAYLAQ